MLVFFFIFAYYGCIRGAVYDTVCKCCKCKLSTGCVGEKNMEQVCAELGLSMSAAFTIFAKKVGREKRIPFDLAIDPFYSESNVRYLEKKMEEYKAGHLDFVEHEV